MRHLAIAILLLTSSSAHAQLTEAQTDAVIQSIATVRADLKKRNTQLDRKAEAIISFLAGMISDMEADLEERVCRASD